MSAPASQTQWYLARDGQQFGPLNDAEMARFIELGHLQPTDLLWREGFPDWRPAMVVFPPARKPRRPPRASGPPHAPPAPNASRRPRNTRRRWPSRPTAASVRATPSRRSPSQGAAARLKRILLIVVCLAVLGAAGWYAYPHRASAAWP